MTFSVFIFDKANVNLQRLSPSDYSACISSIRSLQDNPYPGKGGDKEKLSGRDNRYRLHIGRSYTAVYKIDKEKKRVCVIAFGSIGAIHKIY